MNVDGLAIVTFVVIVVYFLRKYKQLRQLIFGRIRGIACACVTIFLNAAICLTVVDFAQAAHSILLNKRCYDDSGHPPIVIDDWGALFHFKIDSDTRFFILPSAIIIMIAIILFRRYFILQIVGTGLNVWAACGVLFYFQSRAWCRFDPHGYEEEGMVVGYVLVALASLVLIVVFGSFLMLDRGRKSRRRRDALDDRHGVQAVPTTSMSPILHL